MFPITPLLGASLVIAGPPPTAPSRKPLTFAQIYQFVDEQACLNMDSSQFGLLTT